MHGLGLSSLELEKLVMVLDNVFGLSKSVDARGVGGLYRLTTLCRMLDWPLLSGLDLVKTISATIGDNNDLWAALTTRNVTDLETDALCSAFDWLVRLSHWMVEAEIAPDVLVALLTPSEPAVVHTSEADVAWLEGLARAFRPLALQPETFRGFETWHNDEAAPVEFTAVTWQEHVTQANPICHPSGVFLVDFDSGAIEMACSNCLFAAGTDPEQTNNAAQLQALVARLYALRTAQTQVIYQVLCL